MKFIIELDLDNTKHATASDCFSAAHRMMTSMMEVNSLPANADMTSLFNGKYINEDYVILCEATPKGGPDSGPCLGRMVITRDVFDGAYRAKEQSKRHNDRITLETGGKSVEIKV